ncbi:MAG: hypothetical protein ACTSVL_01920, partial [Promethearchaeota archaeon]
LLFYHKINQKLIFVILKSLSNKESYKQECIIMRISTNLTPLNFEYPLQKDIPKNLLNEPLGKKFIATSHLIPFKEQYASEERPHIIRHIHYQFGTINKRRALQFYYNKKPIKIVFSNKKDPLGSSLMASLPPRVKFPETTVSSSVARSLREFALKWIVEHFFNTFDYLCFDEPILDGVNPDCFMLPNSQAGKFLNIDTSKIDTQDNPAKMIDIELDNALFVEIKAYHHTSIVGEKEVLQAFNYAAKGGKALLLTTGSYGELDSFSILNESRVNADNSPSEYAPEVWEEFTRNVKQKFKKLIKHINMKKSQDSFDTRGIYISASSKLKKIYKYTSTWPKEITYKILKTPEEIVGFFHSPEKLGLIEPEAFRKLLLQKNLPVSAELFENVRKSYLEEIIIDPTILYPKF